MSDPEKPKSSWRQRRQSIKHKWAVPFIFPEWLCERLSYFLGQWALLDILGHAGRLAVLIAVIFYFAEADERRMQAENQRKAKQYHAWQVINTAQGKPVGGGRKDALQDLHKEGISLAGVDISRAYLSELNLAGADLRDANLAEAILIGSNLAGAHLWKANLAGADLYRANLTEAYLRHANLSGANLGRANLAGAELSQAYFAGAKLSGANFIGTLLMFANLSGTNLRHADLARAELYRANLTGADLMEANFAGAELRDAILRDIKNWKEIQSIEFANIYDVNNPPDGFIEWATAPEQGAVQIDDDDEWRKLREKRQPLSHQKWRNAMIFYPEDKMKEK